VFQFIEGGRYQSPQWQPGLSGHCCGQFVQELKNDDPTNSPSATCGGQECYLNGGWYTNWEVNWEDAWVEDAWFTLKNDPYQKEVAVSLHETPLS
jgi:hypothetical protein